MTIINISKNCVLSDNPIHENKDISSVIDTFYLLSLHAIVFEINYVDTFNRRYDAYLHNLFLVKKIFWAFLLLFRMKFYFFLPYPVEFDVSDSQ